MSVINAIATKASQNSTNDSGNASSVAQNLDEEEINTKVDIDKETKKEMDDFDDEAEKQVNAEYGSDSDAYTMLD